MIDWLSFLVVFFTSLLSAAAVVALFSLGVRFLATPGRDSVAAGPSRDDENDDVDGENRPTWATVLGYICFGLSICCVLFGIYLIVPAFHG